MQGLLTGDERLLLGIDIGTTKAAAVIVADDGTPVASASREHGTGLPCPAARAEQDVEALLDAAADVVCELPDEARRSVRAVGVTGQMHGVVVLDAAGEPLTPLITWQDGRCLEGGFLDGLNAAVGGRLRAGYGCATLAWLVEKGELPATASSSAGIGDLLVARLCGGRPVADATGAASWGLFDLARSAWDAEAVAAADIPEALLPEVVPCGSSAGAVCPEAAAKLGIPQGIPVTTAIGDNQASLLATLTDPERELALTLGTGGQLSAVLPTGEDLPALSHDCPYEYRPYPGERTLIVAASLCGGAAWAWLADAAVAWTTDLTGQPPRRENVFARLNELGAEAGDELTVRPHFLGERWDASLRGVIEGIDRQNFRLGAVARALARGIVENLKRMMPERVLEGRERVVGSGNALHRNPLLQQIARDVFDLPLTMADDQEEAATGAALLARSLL